MYVHGVFLRQFAANIPPNPPLIDTPLKMSQGPQNFPLTDQF